MSWEGGLLGGSGSLLDAQALRIFLYWILEISGTEQEWTSGRSGVMTLPRVLSLATDGSLQIEPVPELECLRMNQILRAPDKGENLEDFHREFLGGGETLSFSVLFLRAHR